MESFRARELSARAPGAEVPVQLDGEVWGALPMSFRVEPRALEVIGCYQRSRSSICASCSRSRRPANASALSENTAQAV